MSRTLFDALKTRSSRKPARRRPHAQVACRPRVEALEDRTLPSFYAPVTYEANSEPSWGGAVEAGDFNGDGRPDLVTSRYHRSTMSVLLGNADGTFQSARTYATGPGPGQVVVGDFNGDGKLDAVVPNQAGVGISLLLGNGDGTLQPARLFGDVRYDNVATGDFNGDGRHDLVVANGDWTAVAIARGNSDGTFGALQYVPLGFQQPSTSVVGDFNGDGRLDLVVTASHRYTELVGYDEFGEPIYQDFSDGYLNVLLGGGDGTFTWISSDRRTSNVTLAADFNGDGNLDVASSSEVFLGNGAGGLQSSGNVPGNATHTYAASGDFNGDGKIDLASRATHQHPFQAPAAQVAVNLGNGTGTFATPLYFPVGVYPQALAVSDFNADGFADVAAVTSESILVLLNTGDWRSFSITGLPDPPYFALTAGETRSITVTALDNAGNLLPSYTGTVHFASEDPQADLPADYTFSAADQGSHTFVVTLKTAGAWWVTVTDTATADFAGQRVVSVRPALTSRFAVAGFPSPSSPGSGGEFTVHALDPYGNITPDYEGMVHFTSSDPAAVLPNYGNFTETGGVSFFWATLMTVGTQSITVTDTADPSISGSQAGIVVIQTLSINDVTLSEGNTAARAATFTVTLSAASSQTVTVAYATANGTAAAGSDYQAASGTLTFAPGQTSKTITVLVNGDRLGELNETFFVNLSSATNADGQGVGTILDDEPRISISDVSKAEGKKGQKTRFTFTVMLSAAYDQAVTMSVRTVDGTATTADGDYVAQTGTLTFAPGETTKTITIEVKGDSKNEANETFNLDLFGLSSNGLFAKSRGIGTILNDD